MPLGTLTWASLATIIASAIASVGVALFTSWRVDREKTRLAAEQRNIEILIGARLKEYPALYSLLSDLQKAFDRCPSVSLDPPSLLKKFNEWDSRHAILMSRDTSNCCNDFRNALIEVVFNQRVPGENDNFDELIRLAQRLELALRTDLGIEGTRQKSGHLVQEKDRY